MTSDEPTVTIVTLERFADHRPPAGHPERPERAEVMHAVAEAWRGRGARVLESRSAAVEELRLVHDAPYLDRIAGTAGCAVSLDPDTFASPRSHEAALLAAGAGLVAVDRVMTEGPIWARACAFVRPPGHHAERDRAMGFCLFNNVAVAAAHALQAGASRVAIVDYDVHHGNGTQWMFYEDPRVLYVSTHQYPFYPGTGAADQIGRGEGLGFTLNVPIEAGATDADYVAVFEGIIVPVLEQFRPELILVSAGFDAHHKDPLAGMKMTAQGFGALTQMVCTVSERCCHGRLVVVTEGGYDLETLSECLDRTMGVVAGKGIIPGSTDAPAGRRAVDAMSAVRTAQASYWRL